MDQLTEKQIRDMRARNARKGKVEMPPVLTEEDDRILDKIFRDIGKDESTKILPPESK